MTAPYPHQDFARIESSGSVAVFSIKTAWGIRDLRKSIGNAAASFFALLVAIPLLFLLYGLLRYSVWSLARTKPFVKKLNTGNYKAFRLHLEKISVLSNTLDPLRSIDLSKRKWLARVFLSQAVKTAQILLRHKNEMERRVKQLDEPLGISALPKGWQVFNSDERWDSRPKPYEYIA